ncbi:MAG: hypothetical protein CW691_02110 [Candidatus Bathyarchaeum sp.]|nr:MAG: hypothetical protein CW691_02110 [Candidatus Bathyarchaeum sp.]
MKRLVVLLVIFSMFSCVVPVFGLDYWNQTYGTEEIEEGRWVIQTSDDGYAVGGYTRDVTADEYDRDFLLVKTDVNGIMEWNQTYELKQYDTVASFVETSDGGFAIAGESSGGWLIKTDETGMVLWKKTYSTPDTGERPYGIIETVDGKFVLAGSTWTVGEGGTDVWLIKTDQSGNMEWNQTYATDGGDRANSVIVTSDGGFALAGSGWSTNSSSYDFWLIKTDEMGVMQWNRTYNYKKNYWSDANFVFETDEGGFVVAGIVRFPMPLPFSHFWVIRTDAYGNVKWTKTYGETEHEKITAIVSTSDGGYAMTGYWGTENSENVLLLKIDSMGNVKWKQTFGGPEKDVGYSLIETSDRCYVVIGETQSFGNGETDFLLIKSDEMGNIPEFPSWTPLLITLVTMVVVAVVYRKRLAK